MCCLKLCIFHSWVVKFVKLVISFAFPVNVLWITVEMCTDKYDSSENVSLLWVCHRGAQLLLMTFAAIKLRVQVGRTNCKCYTLESNTQFSWHTETRDFVELDFVFLCMVLTSCVLCCLVQKFSQRNAAKTHIVNPQEEVQRCANKRHLQKLNCAIMNKSTYSILKNFSLLHFNFFGCFSWLRVGLACGKSGCVPFPCMRWFSPAFSHIPRENKTEPVSLISLTNRAFCGTRTTFGVP